MITDSFDNISEAIIAPEAFYGARKKVCDIAIATFSREIYETVLGKYPNVEIDEIRAANRIKPIHLIEIDGVKTAFYLSEIGSALASTDVIEVNWKTGADKFIMFGSAGALDNEVTKGKYVIPTDTYRDEGMSYHYAPPSDYIKIRNASFIAEVFEKNGIPYVMGKNWTTDAIYMETREKVRKRREEGCISVEMELAGVQAVCDYYGFELYDFLVTGDVVNQPNYSVDGLHDANHSFDKFDVAIEILKEIQTDEEAF